MNRERRDVAQAATVSGELGTETTAMGTYWIIDGADWTRCESFERARDGACHRASVDALTRTVTDKHGDGVQWEARGTRTIIVECDEAARYRSDANNRFPQYLAESARIARSEARAREVSK